MTRDQAAREAFATEQCVKSSRTKVHFVNSGNFDCKCGELRGVKVMGKPSVYVRLAQRKPKAVAAECP